MILECRGQFLYRFGRHVRAGSDLIDQLSQLRQMVFPRFDTELSGDQLQPEPVIPFEIPGAPQCRPGDLARGRVPFVKPQQLQPLLLGAELGDPRARRDEQSRHVDQSADFEICQRGRQQVPHPCGREPLAQQARLGERIGPDRVLTIPLRQQF
ncbi:hypothetical protein IU486_32300 [Streptomyces gardneri]|nr:hypothetical protein [Streptomyces gardneri]